MRKTLSAGEAGVPEGCGPQIASASLACKVLPVSSAHV